MSAEPYRPPRRADYLPSVRAFLPGVDGEELQLRASMLYMRDCAMATKPAACPPAFALLDVIERLASEFAFRSMALDDLREMHRLMVMTGANASGFDALYSPQLPLPEPAEKAVH